MSQKRSAAFVCVFRAVFKRVFRWWKICALYFKICLTYFELCQTYFFFAPTWGKRAENQFSFFLAGNARFRTSGFLSAFVCFGVVCRVVTCGVCVACCR